MFQHENLRRGQVSVHYRAHYEAARRLGFTGRGVTHEPNDTPSITQAKKFGNEDGLYEHYLLDGGTNRTPRSRKLSLAEWLAEGRSGAHEAA